MEINDRIYCYEGSDVLINKLGIHDAGILAAAECRRIFSALRRERQLGMAFTQTAVKTLAYFFSEINALHPFREGNGRAQREFIRELALSEGYIIEFYMITEGEMLHASRESFLSNYGLMENLFGRCIRDV